MESPPLESAPHLPKRKPFRALLIALAALIILTAGALVLFAPHSTNEKMSWLTPAQMAQAIRPGPLTRLKYRLESMIGPFRRFFHQRPKGMVMITSDIFTLPSTPSGQFDLGAPASTNIDGMRAWVLSPDELTSFRKRLKATADKSMISSPRISTADGIQSQMCVGNSLPIGGSLMRMVGLTVDIIPKVAGDSLKLLVEVTDTETNSDNPAASLSLKTNLAVACRASIPNAGALVIDGGKGGDKKYWLVLAPALIDAKGKPIKTTNSHP